MAKVLQNEKHGLKTRLKLWYFIVGKQLPKDYLDRSIYVGYLKKL